MSIKNSAAMQKVAIALGAVAVVAGAYYASSMKVPMISAGPADARPADAAAPLTDANAIPSATANAIDAALLDAGAAPTDASGADASPYDVHLANGVDLAKNKKYAEAIAAFSLALKDKPDDARALAERGQAKFSSEDYRGGNEDLAQALTKTKDPEALADIWLRRGYLDQKLFGAEAKSAFRASYASAPSKEAEAAMGPRCEHSVERRDLSANPKVSDGGADAWLHSAPNVASLFPELAGWNEQHEALPDSGKPTDAQAWTAATGSATAPVLPTVVRLYDHTKAASYLVFRAKSRVWALQLSQLFNVWNATGDEAFTILTADAGRIHVHGYHAQAKEEVTPVPGGNAAHATLEGRLVEVDAIVDVTKNRLLLVSRDKPGRFAERESTPSLKATLIDGGFKLDGLGCDAAVPMIEGAKLNLDAGVKDAARD